MYIKVDDLNYSNRDQNDSQMKVQEDSKFSKVKIGSTIFPKRGAAIMTNKVRILAKDSYMDTNMMALEPDGINGEFLYMFICRTGLYKIADTSTIPQINNKHIEPYEILMPSIEEQDKIGTYFKQLDNTIALLQRKLDKLKQLKQGFLQQMFPQDGENVPRLRFANFGGEWEERKLKELSYKVIEKNKDNLFSETLTNSAEFGIINQRDFFDKDISNEKNLGGYYVVHADDFVYNPRLSNFAPVGPIKRNKLGRTGVMSPLYYVFRTHDIDNSYLEVFFDSTGWHNFMKLNGDSGARADRFAIKDSVFIKMPIPYPSSDEQVKIGEFFKSLDLFIPLLQIKLDKLETLKKSYLQKMFI